MDSVWMDGIPKPDLGTLNGDKKTDVLIIGGGITGILCAHALRNAGVDCILVEADKICCGITKNTTAKITLAHSLIYDQLIKLFGKKQAGLYLEAQQNAMKEYEKLCSLIPCDYEKKDSYVYSLNDTHKLLAEIKALKALGITAEFAPTPKLPIETVGAVRVKDQSQFHPLKFAYGIAKDLPAFENTKVRQLMPGKAITDHGTITSKKTIIATHFPILNKHGGYFLKMYQHRSYVLALSGAPDVNGMYIDESGTGLSFRNYNGLLLLGGGAHRTGKKGGSYQVLEAFKDAHYKNAAIVTKWATQDCMTLDGVPYIGCYSKATPELFVATGFNKWGMTSAMVAANLLARLVKGKKSSYQKVFSPSRSILHPQLAVNAFESVLGILTPTAPRCPHLGCALKYNPAEHSWDCPCHGSRFTEDGRLIDNPATDDRTITSPR